MLEHTLKRRERRSFDMAEGIVDGNRAVLVHERVEPFVHEGVGECNVSVTLTEKRGGSIEGKKITFFLDGSADPLSQSDTNEHGRASAALQGLRQGKHTVIAVVAGSGLRIEIPVVVPGVSKKKQPVDLRVFFAGSRGRQKLIITVSDEDGIRIPNVEVTVMDGDNVLQYNADMPYQMDFNEESRLVQVVVGNAKHLVWQGRLLGPK